MTNQLLTVEEAAERLKLGRTKIYELMDSGDLPSITFGRARRIPESAVDALITRKLEEAAHA